MTPVYYYQMYGLVVQSELELPEAWETGPVADADVRVYTGSMPRFLRKGREAGYRRWMDGFARAWFATPGAGEFFVENGKTICVQPEQPAHSAMLLRSLLLSAGLCLILLQRGVPVFHGAGLVVGQRAFLLCGASGAGKSTVACHLLAQPGVGFLADDTLAVQVRQSDVLAQPTAPRQKLCRDMLHAFGYSPRHAVYIDEGRDKFSLLRHEAYVCTAAPLGGVYLLERHAKSTVEVCPVKGGTVLLQLVQNLYLVQNYREELGLPPALGKQLARIAADVPFYRVRCPQSGQWGGDAASKIIACHVSGACPGG